MERFTSDTRSYFPDISKEDVTGNAAVKSFLHTTK